MSAGAQSDPQAALAWIVRILEEHKTPFIIVGGLAARAHGATRALVDIDLYVPGAVLDDLPHELRPAVVDGPRHVVTDRWDITFVAMEYRGQRVELGSADGVKIFDHGASAWRSERIDFSDHVQMEIYGVVVPVHVSGIPLGVQATVGEGGRSPRHSPVGSSRATPFRFGTLMGFVRNFPPRARLLHLI